VESGRRVVLSLIFPMKNGGHGVDYTRFKGQGFGHDASADHDGVRWFDIC